MNYLDELNFLLGNKGMTALKTLLFGGWRGGSAVKEGKGKRGERQTAQGQRVGLTEKG